MRRWLRRLLAAVAAVFLLLALAAGGGLLWLRTSLPETSGEVLLAGRGLDRPAAIRRDERGVPFIEAASETDAAFALGFVHAQDRLWQMEMQRRIGAGRLAEIVGEPGLAADRFMRTLGLYRLAQHSYRHLDRATRATLDAYADGVNAFLATHRGALPPEFVLLRFRPEPWQAADSLVWGRLMAMQLGANWTRELLRSRLRGRLGPEEIEMLFGGDGGDPAGGAAAPGGPSPELLERLAATVPDIVRPRRASNAWAVREAGSGGGAARAVLANDPHLGFAVPNLWYLASLRAPDWRATGATVPGVPFLLLGHNGTIAWGMTTTHGDTMDLVYERLSPGRTDSYDTPDGPAPFAEREEIIRIRGGTEHRIVVRESRHGPILSDVVEALGGSANEGYAVALHATALVAEDTTPDAIHMLSRARTWDEFQAALARFKAPQQNVLYADRLGNIGITTAGLVPIRRHGDGFVPAAGWTGEADWTGFVPFAALPRRFNPAVGRIVNANDRPAPAGYPYFLGREFDAPLRAERIEALLDGLGDDRLSAARHAELQTDIRSPLVEALLPLLERLLAERPPGDREADEARRLLAAWDGAAAAGRPEPLILWAWLRRLHHRLLADELGPLAGEYRRVRPAVMRRILEAETAWCDDRATPAAEGCPEQVSRAFDEAMAELRAALGGSPASWRWGAVHRARFDHRVLGRLPLVGRLAGVASPTGGDDYTVSRGSSRLGDGALEEAFAHVHGAGLRAVYDLADPNGSLFATALGQSGNPLSPHFRDGHADWLAGASRPLRPPGDRVAPLVLRP